MTSDTRSRVRAMLAARPRTFAVDYSRRNPVVVYAHDEGVGKVEIITLGEPHGYRFSRMLVEWLNSAPLAVQAAEATTGLRALVIQKLAEFREGLE